jgi:hypothetical protein
MAKEKEKKMNKVWVPAVCPFLSHPVHLDRVEADEKGTPVGKVLDLMMTQSRLSRSASQDPSQVCLSPSPSQSSQSTDLPDILSRLPFRYSQ